MDDYDWADRVRAQVLFGGQSLAREREILRVAASLGTDNAIQTGAVARHEILSWAQNRTSGRLPREAWEYAEFEHLSGGRNCTVVRIENHGNDVWAIRADDPDKNVPQRIWTTEAVVGIWQGKEALFSLRLLTNGAS